MPEQNSIPKVPLRKRIRYSLGGRLALYFLSLTFILAAAGLCFGYYLYSRSVQYNYAGISTRTAETVTLAVDMDEVEEYLKGAEQIYFAFTERQLQVDRKKLQRSFRRLKDEQFREIQRDLYDFAEASDVSAIIIGLYDEETDRIIDVLNSDYKGEYLFSGNWDYLHDVEERRDYRTGDDAPYILLEDERYGYVCAGWAELPSEGRLKHLILCEIDINNVVQEARRFLREYIFLMVMIMALLNIGFVYRMNKYIADPINDISEAARSYINDKNAGILDQPHFQDLKVRSGDEVENLATTLADMEKEIGEYIRDIMTITRDRQRIASELDIAARIQEGMLPTVFPPFPDRHEFEIYAMMETAKEVGGDFYDFFFTDDDHLALVIADVSGKSIPGALFMMMTKILIRNIAPLIGNDPAAILARLNESVMENNKAEMFVTVWLGILEVPTGKLTAANAGHEYPCVRKNGGPFTLFQDPHGLVVGAMEDISYKNYELDLEPGDSLFLYTDGVPEAEDPDSRQFTTDRMLETLNADPEADPEHLLQNIRSEVLAFSQNADQFDDITMLTLRYFGTMTRKNEITTDALLEKIPEVTAFIDGILEEHMCPMKVQMQIDIAVDEIFSNIARYAYGSNVGTATVTVDIEPDPKTVVITFSDSGKPFDPLSNKDPDTTLSAEKRGVGGLGVFLVKKTMDHVAYEYRGGRNILTIRKSMKK